MRKANKSRKCQGQTATDKGMKRKTRGWSYVPYVIHMFGGLFVYGGPHSVEEMYTNPTESKKKKKKIDDRMCEKTRYKIAGKILCKRHKASKFATNF